MNTIKKQNMQDTKETRKADGTFAPHCGNHGNKRKDVLAVKGKQGFQKHPVVVIAPDGTATHLPGIAEATRFLKVKNRQMVTRAILGGYSKHGYKVMYEEDWSPFADYSFRPPMTRDDEGRMNRMGLKMARARQEHNMTDEQKRRRSEMFRELSIRMAHDPNSNWGKGNGRKPIHCVNNNKDYHSVAAAARDIGVRPSSISNALTKGFKVHGYKFYRKSAWDAANNNSILP